LSSFSKVIFNQESCRIGYRDERYLWNCYFGLCNRLNKRFGPWPNISCHDQFISEWRFVRGAKVAIGHALVELAIYLLDYTGLAEANMWVLSNHCFVGFALSHPRAVGQLPWQNPQKPDSQTLHSWITYRRRQSIPFWICG